MDPTILFILLLLLALVLLSEQISYRRKKGKLPGPSLVFPLLGNALPLVRHPTHFWRKQSALAASSPQGASVNYILGRFILYIHTSHLSHFVFNNVRPDAFLLLGHPFGRKLFGRHNLIYMTGSSHRALRRRISPVFSPRSLSTYTRLQYPILLRHLLLWKSLSSSSPRHPHPLPLRLLCRDLNLETSQTVFVGPYLDHSSRLRFSADYAIFNLGLLALPIDLPGFAFREARLAVRRLVLTLADCARASRVFMRTGAQPRCLIDFWVQQQIDEGEEEDGAEELGTYLFDFLFAAQDASTSALVWAVVMMGEKEEVVEKVREEVRGVWWPGRGEGMGAEEVRRLKYTETVAREVVRIRTPATMVPHVAGEEMRMGGGEEGWRIPKGSIVFPSIFDSSFQGFTEPERFDPERFGEERREDKRFRLNYLGFGAGAHQCVGERYAISHLVLFIAVFTAVFDWRRERSHGCDDIVYLPTIFPKDDCLVHLHCRSSPVTTME